MLAFHDHFTHEMCDRIETTSIGLGLVRLLQEAKRFEEARTVLYSLEGIESVKPSDKNTKRITRSRSSASIKIEAA